MLTGRLTAGVAMAVVLLAGCAGNTAVDPPSPSSAPPPKPPPMLDGTYRLDLNRSGQQVNGQPDPRKPKVMHYALRSTCDGDRCVATGFRVHDERFDGRFDLDPTVFDFIDGAWTMTESDYVIECGGVIAPGLSTLSFVPREDGTLSGSRRLACFVPTGSVATEYPVVLTRVADVASALPIPDPAKVIPLTASTGAGLNGPYRITYTPTTGGETTVLEANLSTGCTRNTERCLTYATIQGADGPPAVTAWRRADGRWSNDWIRLAECGAGIAPISVGFREEWVAPETPAHPIQRAFGTRWATLGSACPAVPAESSVRLERIVD